MEAIPSQAPVRRRWFLVGLLALFIVLSVQYSVKVRKHGDGSSAFNRWRRQVIALEQGENSYEKYAYPNPPMMALLLLPYYKVPELAGALAWFYTKVVLALLSLVWIFRMVEDPDRPFPDWAKALAVLLSLKPIMGDLTHGNVNLIILFLVVAALYAYSRQRNALAGLALALAIVCKVTPLLFVPYFVWKRAWKTLAACVVGLALFYVVVPGLYLGQARNAALLKSWYALMIEPFVKGKEFPYPEHFNQSLPGLVHRLCTHSPSRAAWIDDQTYQPLQYHNVVELTSGQVRGLIMVCMALFGLLVLGVCRTPPARRQGWRLAAEFSIVILGMLLFSERTWKHHCVTLAVPFAVICYQLAWTTERRGRAALIAVLVATVLLMGSTSVLGVGEEWDELARLTQVYGAYVWVFLILAATLAVMLWKDRQAAGRVASVCASGVLPYHLGRFSHAPTP